jgi:hypothetical protein
MPESALGPTLQGVCRSASPRVHFGPKTDLIPTPNAVAHASRLCNRAEEYAHAGSSECDRRIQASAMEQGKVDRGKAAAATQTRLVDPDKLQIEGRARDLAMFNLATDSKLRGCDVVAIRVEDVAAGGYTADRATVRQRKTGRPVRFELSEQTRQAVDDYLKATGKRPREYLFTGRRGPDRSMTTRQYARLVSEWIGSVGLDPRLFVLASKKFGCRRPMRVKRRNTRFEPMFTALPPTTDIAQYGRHVRSVPQAEVKQTQSLLSAVRFRSIGAG